MLAKNDSCENDYQHVVDEVVKLTAHLTIPEHFNTSIPRRIGHEFDVMEYFSILPHLSMQEGYVLDYVYWHHGGGAEPVLYTRKVTETCYETSKEYEKAGGLLIGSRENYRAFESLSVDDIENSKNNRYFLKAFITYCNAFLEKIHIDDTEQGYFEFIVLKLLGPQFYLEWHANYYDDVLICSKRALHQVLEKNAVSDDVKEAAMDIDIRPRIHITPHEATVEVVVFTKWGGFLRERFVITREFPHTIHMKKPEDLVFYWCGIII